MLWLEYLRLVRILGKRVKGTVINVTLHEVEAKELISIDLIISVQMKSFQIQVEMKNHKQETFTQNSYIYTLSKVSFI